jgi:hypothetical protein
VFERERETDRQTDRETETERYREIGRQKGERPYSLVPHGSEGGDGGLREGSEPRKEKKGIAHGALESKCGKALSTGPAPS